MRPEPHILAIIKKAPVFSALAEPVLVAFLQHCEVRSLAASRQVFRGGQEADRFFVVLEGHVKIYKVNARGDEQILHLYGPGESFGEAAMWAGGKFPAIAETLEDSRLLVVLRSTLRSELARSVDLSMGMLAGLSFKLREFATLIEQLSLKDVPSRVASVLLAEARRAQAHTFRLRQTKRELASQIGTVPETLSRALNRLKSDGVIQVEGSSITILNHPALEELAHNG